MQKSPGPDHVRSQGLLSLNLRGNPAAQAICSSAKPARKTIPRQAQQRCSCPCAEAASSEGGELGRYPSSQSLPRWIAHPISDRTHEKLLNETCSSASTMPTLRLPNESTLHDTGRPHSSLGYRTPATFAGHDHPSLGSDGPLFDSPGVCTDLLGPH
jgi:hypothetical protein